MFFIIDIKFNSTALKCYNGPIYYPQYRRSTKTCKGCLPD